MPRTIKRLPHNARYDYEDICGWKHYHSDKRVYLVWRNRNGVVVKSYSKNEEF